MKNCRIILNCPAVDAYLYGGYLFLFRADGTVGYIRFERLLSICIDDNKDAYRDLKLAFLPYQKLKGGSYDFMLEYSSIKNALSQEIDRVSSTGVWVIDSDTFNDSFHPFCKFDDMPLDVIIYGGEAFMGNSDGLFKSALNADSKYKLNPYKFQKVFDGEAIHLSSKCGTIAISSAQNGLFSYDLFSGLYVADKPVFDEYSTRSDWSVGDTLLNYSSDNVFSLLINKISRAEDRLDVPKGCMDDNLSKKYVELFGVSKFKMEQLFQKVKSLEDNLTYVFSSVNSGFFISGNGGLEVRNLQDKDADFYYSSKTLFSKNLGDILKNENPISAKTFPGGCVIELYNKILLICKDEVEILANEPVFSVRTYMNSNSYRNLITIVCADHVEIIAIPMFPEKGRGASSFRPNSPIDNSPNNTVLEDLQVPTSDENFPF